MWQVHPVLLLSQSTNLVRSETLLGNLRIRLATLAHLELRKVVSTNQGLGFGL